MKVIDQWYLASQPYNKMPAPPEDVDAIDLYLIGVTQDQGGEKTEFRSSPLRSRIDGESQVVTRSGSVYQLGAPDPEYAKLYPNPERTLLEGLPVYSPPAADATLEGGQAPPGL